MTPVTEAPAAVKLTERINRIKPSATMAVVAEADKLRQQGVDVVDLSVGEPHFSTPQHIKDAAITAIEENFTKYTAAAGTAELRDAITHRHNVDFDSDYRREEAVVSVGGKHVLFNALQVLVEHGDEVILPVPYWVSFKDMVQYAGGKCVFLETEEAQGFRVTAEMVSRLVTPKTKLIILNSPSNPSGAVISPDDQKEIVRFAAQRGIWVMSDECYVYLNYTDRQFSVGSLREYRDRIVIAGSLSKTYAMTGWRMGFALAPPGSRRSHGEAAEPVHVESDFYCSESGGGGAQVVAGVRRADARRVYPAAQPCSCGPARHARNQMQYARGRLLRVSQCVGLFRTRRSEFSCGFFRQAAAGVPCGNRSRRRLRHSGTHSGFLCHVGEGT